MSEYNIDSADLDTEKETNNKDKTEAVAGLLEDKKARSMIMASLIAGAIGGILGVYLFSGALGSKTPGEFLKNTERVVVDEESAVIDVAAKTKPAIVSIVGTKKVAARAVPDDFFFFFPFAPAPQPQDGAETETRVSAGTGFFVRSDGLIAINKHVISDSDADYKVYANDGRTFAAQVVARDPVNDIALLKIEGANFPLF